MVEVGNNSFLKVYLKEYFTLIDSDFCCFGVFDVIKTNPHKSDELQVVVRQLNDGMISTLEAAALSRAVVND